MLRGQHTAKMAVFLKELKFQVDLQKVSQMLYWHGSELEYLKSKAREAKLEDYPEWSRALVSELLLFSERPFSTCYRDLAFCKKVGGKYTDEGVATFLFVCNGAELVNTELDDLLEDGVSDYQLYYFPQTDRVTGKEFYVCILSFGDMATGEGKDEAIQSLTQTLRDYTLKNYKGKECLCE